MCEGGREREILMLEELNYVKLYFPIQESSNGDKKALEHTPKRRISAKGNGTHPVNSYAC